MVESPRGQAPRSRRPGASPSPRGQAPRSRGKEPLLPRGQAPRSRRPGAPRGQAPRSRRPGASPSSRGQAPRSRGKEPRYRSGASPCKPDTLLPRLACFSWRVDDPGKSTSSGTSTNTGDGRTQQGRRVWHLIERWHGRHAGTPARLAPHRTLARRHAGTLARRHAGVLHRYLCTRLHSP